MRLDKSLPGAYWLRETFESLQTRAAYYASLATYRGLEAHEALRGLPPTVPKEDTTRWTRFPPRMLGCLIAPHDPRTLFGMSIGFSAVKSI